MYDILLSKTTGHEGKPVFGFVIKIDWHTAKPIVVPDPSSLIFQGESSFRTDHRDPRYRSPVSPIADLSGSSVHALPEQARNARLKLRANRRKARCSGSPTEVDDRSSSSPFSSSLTLCRALPASGSLSLPPFAVPPPPSRASTLLIYLPICLSGYLRRRAGPPSLSHPHIARPTRSRRARARYSEIV